MSKKILKQELNHIILTDDLPDIMLYEKTDETTIIGYIENFSSDLSNNSLNVKGTISYNILYKGDFNNEEETAGLKSYVKIYRNFRETINDIPTSNQICIKINIKDIVIKARNERVFLLEDILEIEIT